MYVSENISAALQNFIGVAIGATTSIVTSVITTKSEIRRSREEREERRRQEKKKIQRDICVELQEALWKQMRAVWIMWLEDQEDFRKSGIWNPKHQLSEKTNQLELNSGRQVLMLTQRLTDNELRRELEATYHQMSKKYSFNSPKEEMRHVNRCMDVYDRTMNALGLEIRRLS